MQAQLTQLEADYSIEWQDFRIGDLFDIGTGSLVDIKKAQTGKTPRISVQTSSNGILGYYSEPLENARYFKNFISINFFGNSYYHPYRASVEMKVHTLTPKEYELTESFAFFTVTSLNKKLINRFSYGEQLSSSKLKNDELNIQLPTIRQNGEAQIAFDFMEAFIATLKAERLATLKAYLTVTGLTDTTLTSAEQTALDSLNSVAWGRFKIRDMFENIIQGRRLKKQDQTSGALPFVMAGVTNTGVVNYIGNDTRVFPKNSLTVDIFGNVFYRSYEYGMGDDTGAYWNEDNKIPKLAMLYIATIMQKYMAGKFDYGHKLRSSRSLDFRIPLPITTEGRPDYETMSLVVSALQKVVIQGVVSYLDARIETTAELV